jgi:hypothetical protein
MAVELGSLMISPAGAVPRVAPFSNKIKENPDTSGEIPEYQAGGSNHSQITDLAACCSERSIVRFGALL